VRPPEPCWLAIPAICYAVIASYGWYARRPA